MIKTVINFEYGKNTSDWASNLSENKKLHFVILFKYFFFFNGHNEWIINCVLCVIHDQQSIQFILNFMKKFVAKKFVRYVLSSISDTLGYILKLKVCIFRENSKLFLKKKIKSVVWICVCCDLRKSKHNHFLYQFSKTVLLAFYDFPVDANYWANESCWMLIDGKSFDLLMKFWYLVAYFLGILCLRWKIYENYCVALWLFRNRYIHWNVRQIMSIYVGKTFRCWDFILFSLSFKFVWNIVEIVCENSFLNACS